MDDFLEFLSFKSHKMFVVELYSLVQLGDRIYSEKSEEILTLFLGDRLYALSVPDCIFPAGF
jgi:hypothetical protein